MTGFTLDLDAEPEVCRRLLNAMWAELYALRREREQRDWVFNLGPTVPSVRLPPYRMEGTLTTRRAIS